LIKEGRSLGRGGSQSLLSERGERLIKRWDSQFGKEMWRWTDWSLHQKGRTGVLSVGRKKSLREQVMLDLGQPGLRGTCSRVTVASCRGLLLRKLFAVVRKVFRKLKAASVTTSGNTDAGTDDRVNLGECSLGRGKRRFSERGGDKRGGIP